MIRSTGRVIRRATARPVTSATSAASPAAPAMARNSAVRRVCSAPPSPRSAEPHHGRPGPPIIRHDRPPEPGTGAPVEPGRGCHGPAPGVPYLDGRPGPRGQVQHRAEMAAAQLFFRSQAAPRPRRPRWPAGPAAVRQGRDVRAGERRRQAGQQGDRHQRHPEERQRQAQADSVTRAGAQPRPAADWSPRRTGRHHGPGRAGTRRRARSGRSGGRPDPPRSCGAGSSRAS